MYTQLRVYTVNRNTMDPWIEWWRQNPKAVGESVGQKIGGPWVNEAKTEFTWLRSYADAEDAAQKDAAFAAHPTWVAARPESVKFIAKAEVTPMLADSIDQPAEMLPYAQLRIYTINRGQMDLFLPIFLNEVIPAHKRHGHVILGPWTNVQRNKLVWFRNYQSPEDAKAKDQALYGSAEWKAMLPRLTYVADPEVRPVFAVKTPARVG